MTDILTKAQRSALMAKVKGRGNASTELKLIAVFRARGITGWRRKLPLPGKPDFVFPKLRIAVFVDGCFWHGCPIHATQPKQNAEFWREKIARNQARDLLVTRQLRARGWRVLRLWEHELTRKYERRLFARLRRIGLLSAIPN
jgi:DNA mismatch endonuclease, patch repair protein